MCLDWLFSRYSKWDPRPHIGNPVLLDISSWAAEPAGGGQGSLAKESNYDLISGCAINENNLHCLKFGRPSATCRNVTDRRLPDCRQNPLKKEKERYRNNFTTICFIFTQPLFILLLLLLYKLLHFHLPSLQLTFLCFFRLFFPFAFSRTSVIYDDKCGFKINFLELCGAFVTLTNFGVFSFVC